MALCLHIGLNALRSNAEGWGDLQYARCLAAALEQLGHQTRLFFRDEMPELTGQGDVVLRIIGPHLDEPVPDVPNLLWVISPPNQAYLACLARYQALFFASDMLARQCAALGLAASYLPQATDTGIFNLAARRQAPVDIEVSFVGNLALRVPRSTVREAIGLGFDVRIWGQGWDGVVPARHIGGDRLDITALAQVYARSRVVLNSHMPHMAELGFMSNRSFDAMACGAQVVSDQVQGFADPALPGLTQIGGDQALGEHLTRLLSGTQDRTAIAGPMAEHYSFAARARTLAAEAARQLALGHRASRAFAPLSAQPRRGRVLKVTVSDCPSDAEATLPPLAARLDALISSHQLEVTLVLSDPSATPDGIGVEEAMQRAATAVMRIGAVIAREASLARLTVTGPETEAGCGVIHAGMPDHRAAQRAAQDRATPQALAVLETVCARARRVLECPVGAFLAPEGAGIDPVQARIRLLNNRPLYAHSPAGFSRDRQKRHLRLWPRNSPAKLARPVGVFIHLFYAELATVFRDRMALLDLPHRLYVSTDTRAKAMTIMAQLPTAVVRVVPNRGRDVYGKLYGFADVYAEHDIVLHLHGKKSPHADGLDQWLDHCLACLLPSREEVFRIVSLFQSAPELGLVVPLTFKSVLAAAHWGDNLEIARELVARMQPPCPLPTDADLDFPVGSMFWARRVALEPLRALALTPEHFPPESGQLDATPAHAIERLFGVVCQAGGYRLLRVAPMGSTQHKAQQIVARRNEDVRQALQGGVFGP
ncbi:rhamnan synthesis F family protein [Pseudotabrizicola alkalilacus]|uniref:Glycosyl transferase n=1 Tax=Pseudotabrizicola alkalilacus TaxID=2305252 RepID=A0A411Z1D9_9RHOB|nr:rhamnan synthesis F family protein [Pseudotabrizicola alkalilacus]RGP36880.1 glycosyl transferase [Pseudotabrizicola alkalilacus]